MLGTKQDAMKTPPWLAAFGAWVSDQPGDREIAFHI